MASQNTKIKDLLRAAKLPERSVVICLNQDLQAQVEAKERELTEALARPDMSSLDGVGEGTRIRAEITEIKNQMAESNQEFRFRALPRHQFTALTKAHPAREGDAVDEGYGFNFDTLTHALLRACIVVPDDMDDEAWDMLLGSETSDYPGVLSSAQFDILAAAVWFANRRDVDVPLSSSNYVSRGIFAGV